VLTIDDLPDDDLLAIFDFYVVRYQDLDFRELTYDIKSTYDIKRKTESWQSLVHVCRRWRGLVFGSPRCLNLHLFCMARIYARKSLDAWPALPLLIKKNVSETPVDDLIAELEHSADRICQIDLNCYNTSQTDLSQKLWTAMQVPFPELAVLRLSFAGWSYESVPPDSFLGGSAPRLRSLALVDPPFPGLPKSLLSATHLVRLYLLGLTPSGYILPEAMVTCLSVLTSLEELYFQFHYGEYVTDQKSRRPPPPTRSVLPALTFFSFKGTGEYLEDLVFWIDAPQLYRLSITFWGDHIGFNNPELNQFIFSFALALWLSYAIFVDHRLWFDILV
jgi:hypothetical protein